MAGELGFDTGPFVNVAAFCEQAIQDKDNLMTLVRIVDQITVSATGPGAPDDLPPGTTVNRTLVVVLKPGQARGRQTLKVTLEHPDGSRHPGPEVQVHFTGGPNNGANVVLNMGLGLSTAGLYWADVELNGRLVSRVPLEIMYQKTPGIQQTP